MHDILENAQPLIDWLTKPHYFPSVILDEFIQMPNKRTCFLTVGDKVKLFGGKLINCTDGIPTHVVDKIYGHFNRGVKADLINLETDSKITIQVN